LFSAIMGQPGAESRNQSVVFAPRLAQAGADEE